MSIFSSANCCFNCQDEITFSKGDTFSEFSNSKLFIIIASLFEATRDLLCKGVVKCKFCFFSRLLRMLLICRSFPIDFLLNFSSLLIGLLSLKEPANNACWFTGFPSQMFIFLSRASSNFSTFGYYLRQGLAVFLRRFSSSFFFLINISLFCLNKIYCLNTLYDLPKSQIILSLFSNTFRVMYS